MNDLVAHRGPDGERFLLASGAWDGLRYCLQRRADQTVIDLPIRVSSSRSHSSVAGPRSNPVAYSLNPTRDHSANGYTQMRTALGHRRLASLDLSDRGLQPVCTPARSNWVVFNGKIYNHFWEVRS
jgi:asparagine synthetase B (glutamine-hydrolysing)